RERASPRPRQAAHAIASGAERLHPQARTVTAPRPTTKLILVGAMPASPAARSSSKRTRLYARKIPTVPVDFSRDSAADRFFAVEQLHLGSCRPELQLPALVAHDRDLVGRKFLRIGQQSEQGLRAKALSLIK